MLLTDTKGRTGKRNVNSLHSSHLTMVLQDLTLSDYLRHANPQIDRTQCRKGSNTSTGSSSSRGYKRFPDDVLLWDDFGLSTFDAVHGGALRAELARQYRLREHPNIPKLPFCEVHDENSLDCFLVLWTWQVVSDALAATQRDHLTHHPNEAVYMVRGGQAQFSSGPNSRDPASSEKPDWAAVRRPVHESGLHQGSMKPKIILPGDTKLSSKWSSTQLPRGLRKREMAKNVSNPIGQIYRYCLRANARYGYLITDDELVAVRIDIESPEAFYKRHGGLRRREIVLRFKAIPWDNAASTDPELITINLALWLLHLVAAWDGKINSDQVSLYQALHALDRERGASGQVGSNPTTPTTTTSAQRNVTADRDLSFRSGTSDVRNLLSGASIGDDDREISKTPSTLHRKRGIDETSDEESPRRRRRSGRPSKKRH